MLSTTCYERLAAECRPSSPRERHAALPLTRSIETGLIDRVPRGRRCRQTSCSGPARRSSGASPDEIRAHISSAHDFPSPYSRCAARAYPSSQGFHTRRVHRRKAGCSGFICGNNSVILAALRATTSQAQAVRTMVSTSECAADPSRAGVLRMSCPHRALPDPLPSSATTENQKTLRRGAMRHGTSRPVTRSTASTISRTEKPLPVPRLTEMLSPPPSRLCRTAATCASARSRT